MFEDGFNGYFFRIFEIIMFCFIYIAIFDLVHGAEAIHDLR